MEGRGFVAVKKPGSKYGQYQLRKNGSKDYQHVVKKPFRMNSMAKPSQEISEKFNYGITGLNYSKKKKYDEYQYNLEETKTKPKQKEPYNAGFSKNLYKFQTSIENSPTSSTSNDDKITTMT
mmetsp:Transcript_12156/g.10781  ORF Transcript_12156/g.10781 Transcript_12156/m.10781 type:complete len:122 (-) Transcript_12156:631-996(-)